MENLDNYVDREIRQKQARNQQSQSEAERRLYWSTHRMSIKHQTQKTKKNQQARMGLRRLWALFVDAALSNSRQQTNQ